MPVATPTLPAVRSRAAPEAKARAIAPRQAASLPKFRAEEVLDWLEAHGRAGRLWLEASGGGFRVECEAVER
jgi:hypothetical protein